jgi:hypothetical protein
MKSKIPCHSASLGRGKEHKISSVVTPQVPQSFLHNPLSIIALYLVIVYTIFNYSIPYNYD